MVEKNNSTRGCFCNILFALHYGHARIKEPFVSAVELSRHRLMRKNYKEAATFPFTSRVPSRFFLGNVRRWKIGQKYDHSSH
jgi:hypothetical protein